VCHVVFVTDAQGKKPRVFVSSKPLQPSATLAKEAGAYPSEASFTCFALAFQANIRLGCKDFSG
jgi:hypothetical protein